MPGATFQRSSASESLVNEPGQQHSNDGFFRKNVDEALTNQANFVSLLEAESSDGVTYWYFSTNIDARCVARKIYRDSRLTKEWNEGREYGGSN